jgi:hypothetical protein
MTADKTVERAADKLQQLANQFAGEGGLKAKIAEPLADDADLIRKMKPSLIKARARGDAPMNQPSGHGQVTPAGPQLGKRPGTKKKTGGAGPWLIAGAALFAGIAVARFIAWRGHAHPRD